jgi:hypothetical protein
MQVCVNIRFWSLVLTSRKFLHHHFVFCVNHVGIGWWAPGQQSFCTSCHWLNPLPLSEFY